MGSSFNFDAKRWQRAEQITGAASLLLLISLFLPWFTASVTITKGLSDSVSVSGTGGHHYLWLVFFIALAVVVLLVLMAGFGTLPFNLGVSPQRLLLILVSVNLVLVLLAFLIKPGTGDTQGFHVSVGWGFGAFLGVICAIAAFVPQVLPMARERAGVR